MKNNVLEFAENKKKKEIRPIKKNCSYSQFCLQTKLNPVSAKYELFKKKNELTYHIMYVRVLCVCCVAVHLFNNIVLQVNSRDE